MARIPTVERIQRVVQFCPEQDITQIGRVWRGLSDEAFLGYLSKGHLAKFKWIQGV